MQVLLHRYEVSEAMAAGITLVEAGRRKLAGLPITPSKEEKMRIDPTVGRVVHYYPSTQDRHNSGMVQLYQTHPFRADVVCVHPDGKVNLSIHDHHGTVFAKRNVPIRQLNEERSADGGHAEWPVQTPGDQYRRELQRNAGAGGGSGGGGSGAYIGLDGNAQSGGGASGGGGGTSDDDRTS